jgi:chromosome segregation ATPase
MEWLISASLYNAFGIGAAAYALAQIGFGAWASRLAQSRKRVQKLTDENEQVKGLNENLRTERNQLSDLQHDRKRENSELRQEIQRLKANPDELKRYCQHVAAELTDFDKALRSQPGSDLRAQMETAETEEEVNALKAQEQQLIRQHRDEMIELYHKRHKHRIMELYGALAPRWFDEGDQELFENVTDWPDVQFAAERLRTICRRLSGD